MLTFLSPLRGLKTRCTMAVRGLVSPATFPGRFAADTPTIPAARGSFGPVANEPTPSRIPTLDP